MRISTLLIIFTLSTAGLLGATEVSAQKLSDIKLTVHLDKQNLALSIATLKKISGLDFAYNITIFKDIKAPACSFNNVSMDMILDKLLAETDLSYKVINHNILISFDQEKKNNRAAPGKISGRITDAKTGETLPGVTVSTAGGKVNAISDLQGNYVLPLQPGVYDLEFKYIGYQTKLITGTEVKENGVTPLNILLQQASKELAGVVIKSTYRRESQSALYALQKNSVSVTDGISSELIRRTPDRNAGDALKRVTGVSVLEGKYVVVRGLSDRYNYTTLNGGVLPSTEPDRRAFSLDLIPAQAIESIVVTKTATADLPGEFAGGVVQVVTKDFPDKDFITVALGTGYYTGQTGKTFLKDRNGSQDWLGNDDGGRALPKQLDLNAAAFNKLYPEERFRISNAVSKGWAPVQAGKAQPIQQLQLGYGKTFPFKDNSKLGVVALVNYRRDQTIDQAERYDLAQYKKFSGTAGPGDSLRYLRSYPYERDYRYLINAGGLLNVTYEFGRNKVSVKSLFNRDFETVTTIKNGERTLGNGLADIVPNNVVDMHPTQKTLWGTQLLGEHKLGLENPVTLTWNVAYNTVKKYEPNQTRIGYINLNPNNEAGNNNGNYFVPDFGSIESSSRLYTDLKENAYNVNFAVSTPFKIAGQSQVLKAGAYTQFRKREYFTRNLGYADAGRNVTTPNNSQGFPTSFPVNFNQPIDQILSPENFRPGGLVVVSYELPANQYSGGANLASAFANMESNILNNLKLVYGVRVEFYTMSLSTSKELARRLPASGNTGDDQSPIDYIRYNTDVLPSANLIYSPLPSVNIRAAYSKTLTRPEFREISPYQYFDFVSGYATQGNPDLNRGTIQNLDFRVEWFPSASELFSASIFRKNLHDPVEITTQSTSETAKFIRTYKNIEGALNWGLEFEVRKNLYFGTGPQWLRNITVFGNYSRIYSNIRGKVQGFEGRTDLDQNLRKRPLAGQSPYLINAGLLVNALKNTFSFSAAFNRAGRRIVVVGTTAEDRTAIGAYPDIYENPRNQMDLQLGQKLFKQRLEVKFNAANVLNNPFIQYQDYDLNGKYSGNIYDATVYSRKSFRNYTLTLSYNIMK